MAGPKKARESNDVVAGGGNATQAPSSRIGSLEDLPALITVDELAALLRTSRKAIYGRVARALLPGVVRDGRRLLFDRDDVLDWIDGMRAPAPQDRR